MAITREKIFVDLINRVHNLKVYDQQRKAMLGINKSVQSVSRQQKALQNNMEKTTKVTAGYNKAGKPVVQTIESTRNVSQRLAKEQEQQTRKFTKQQEQQTRSMQLTKVAGYSAGQVMRMNAKDLGKYNEIGGKFNTRGAQMANRFRMMTHGARGFRMELLGVMFFGMAMQRAFAGLLRTSMEWMGIMELFSLTLGVLFLPVAEVLLEWALKFLNWVLQLTDTEKKVIGWFVLIGAAVGTLTFLIGMLGLGIGSMIQAFNFSAIATMMGGTGIGGIGAAATTAASKVGGLKLMLLGLAKYAGIGIAIAMTVKDLKEGQLTAAIGMATLAVGLYTGNPYLIGIGVILKLIGDEDFLSSIVSITLKVLDLFLILGDEIGKIIIAAITPGKQYTMSADVQSAFTKGVAKADMQSSVAKSIGLTIPNATGQGFVPTLEASEKYLQSQGMGNFFITQTNNVTGVSSPEDVKNMLEENNRQLTEEVRRGVGG